MITGPKYPAYPETIRILSKTWVSIQVFLGWVEYPSRIGSGDSGLSE